MRLIIRDDCESASAFVANYITDRIKHFAPTPAHPFVLGLPTGSSPLSLYRILVEKYKAGDVSFENVVTFNMVGIITLSRIFSQTPNSATNTQLCRTNTLASRGTTQRAITLSCGRISSPM